MEKHITLATSQSLVIDIPKPKVPFIKGMAE
jgi:hypothetical protein